MKKCFLGLVLVCSSASVFGGLEEGKAAYEQGDFATALTEFMTVAEQGNSEAQFNLGSLYDKGEGVMQDSSQAAEWYRKAAEQGYARAQYKLGSMHDFTVGEYSKAIEWYIKAAEQNSVEAQNRLGVFYEQGLGVARDYNQAAIWYRKAAEQGYTDALFSLGRMYENGQGVPKNKSLALMLYNLVLASDNAFVYQWSLDNRKMAKLAAELTPAQRAEVQNLVANWKVGMPLPTSTKTYPTSTTKKK